MMIVAGNMHHSRHGTIASEKTIICIHSLIYCILVIPVPFHTTHKRRFGIGISVTLQVGMIYKDIIRKARNNPTQHVHTDDLYRK